MFKANHVELEDKWEPKILEDGSRNCRPLAN